MIANTSYPDGSRLLFSFGVLRADYRQYRIGCPEAIGSYISPDSSVKSRNRPNFLWTLVLQCVRPALPKQLWCDNNVTHPGASKRPADRVRGRFGDLAYDAKQQNQT